MCVKDALLQYLSHNSGKTQIGQVFAFSSVVWPNKPSFVGTRTQTRVYRCDAGLPYLTIWPNCTWLLLSNFDRILYFIQTLNYQLFLMYHS